LWKDHGEPGGLGAPEEEEEGGATGLVAAPTRTLGFWALFVLGPLGPFGALWCSFPFQRGKAGRERPRPCLVPIFFFGKTIL